jgi:DNA-binding NtrC family response regulator
MLVPARAGDSTPTPQPQDTVLVVDDEEGIREFCVGALEDAGFRTETASSGREALNVLEAKQIDIVLSDLKMPEMGGMELLQAIRERDLDADVVIMTANATIPTAVEATRLGAYDYITKPFAIGDLIALLEKLVERRELVVENRVLREQVNGPNGFGGLVGASGRMQELYRTVLKIAPKRCPVLIIGESGTGKELVARAIHTFSPWQDRPFVPVDCGALTPSLIESELFGHVRGAFTGATHDRQGLFRSAADGTIFLDEIGELPLELQAKLLRVLQESEFRAVGSDARVALRARVVAATNRDLEAAIKSKTFRGDLYYRLNVITLRIPPLRRRKEDIAPLARFFVARHDEAEAVVTGISAEAAARLTAYDWPGNVRELENCIRRALALAKGPLLELRDLPPELRWSDAGEDKARSYTYLEEVERRAILEALEATSGQRASAAKLLGIGKTTLYSKLKEYGLEEPGGSEPPPG